MKTLIFNGSPRRNGDTACLLREMKSVLAGEVMEVSAYYGGISPCVDCRHCWKDDGCAINDGMQAVYRAMEEYDNIVVASPLHFSELTGPLMSLAGRFQCLYAGKRFRGRPYGGKKKHGVLILTGGGDGSPEPAVRWANRFFRFANAECVGSVLSLHTDDVPACRDEVAKARARELAWELNAPSPPTPPPSSGIIPLE